MKKHFITTATQAIEELIEERRQQEKRREEGELLSKAKDMMEPMSAMD
jgi:hypothetical protein